MLLTVDVGNTNIKFAVFQGDVIATSFRIRTDSSRTSDEIGISIVNMLGSRNLFAKDIHAVIIASVVPDIMHSLNNAMVKFFGVRPMVVGPGMKTGIRLVKTNPAEVGPDRIVDGVAALGLYGGPIIVADYGTATKFDLFAADGTFESAITCPGVMISARALWEGTARLPEIEIKDPGSAMCKDTTTSLQAGILYGKIGEAEYIIDRLIKEYNHGKITVVATGGMANTIFEKTDRIDFIDPNLNMQGLRLLYEKNK